MYDIAYNMNGDSKAVDSIFFPLSRYKSWFDGHSFASGLFPFADGKSQESSSEAVNGYYGAYLWCLTKHNAGKGSPATDCIDFTRLLLATEIRGAKTYWHLKPDFPSNITRRGRPPIKIYSSQFQKNYMVGNLGMLDVTSSTWFGSNPIYSQLINVLPATSITRELFGRAYVEKEYTNAIQHADIPNPWKGYATCLHALVDPSEAWVEAQFLSSAALDPGISKSQVMYFITQLDGFHSDPTNSTAWNDDDDDAQSSLTSCQANEGCRDANLTGICCPTPNGIMLQCCQ